MPKPAREAFRIAIICALATTERDAVDLVVDFPYSREDEKVKGVDGDDNVYTAGKIKSHDVILLSLPEMGLLAAADATKPLKTSFPNVELALIVGVCGGLPCIQGQDAFLGDVIISNSIIQYDFGRQHERGFRRKTDTLDVPGRPPIAIRKMIADLRSRREGKILRIEAAANLQRLQAASENDPGYGPPADADDLAFDEKNIHEHRGGDCQDCASQRFCETASKATCARLGCLTADPLPTPRGRAAQRPADWGPRVFIGTIASANRVLKSAQDRKAIVEQDEDVIGFEMEGAGAWDHVPCIIVKGICDYADSHKNKKCQDFAAATAASVAAALVGRMPAREKAASSSVGGSAGETGGGPPVQNFNNTAPNQGSQGTFYGDQNFDFRTLK